MEESPIDKKAIRTMSQDILRIQKKMGKNKLEPTEVFELRAEKMKQAKKEGERRTKIEEGIKEKEEQEMKTEEEENRILDAYRGGAINMEQLKVQIGKIQEKRNVLYQEKQELSEQRTQGISSELINKNVKDYCKAIKIRLNNIAFEEKQRILRLLVNRIILEEDRVRIKGIIPLHQNKQQECHIASTITEYYDLR